MIRTSRVKGLQKEIERERVIERERDRFRGDLLPITTWERGRASEIGGEMRREKSRGWNKFTSLPFSYIHI